MGRLRIGLLDLPFDLLTYLLIRILLLLFWLGSAADHRQHTVIYSKMDHSGPDSSYLGVWDLIMASHGWGLGYCVVDSFV